MSQNESLREEVAFRSASSILVQYDVAPNCENTCHFRDLTRLVQCVMLWLPIVPAAALIFLPASRISSPYDSIEGCREWLLEFIILNSSHCPSVNRHLIDGNIYSRKARPQKVYNDARTKLKDAKYKCDFERSWTGCSPEFVNKFKQTDFYMLCENIDGVEARVKILHDHASDPDRAYMYCTEQDNHRELVVDRLIAVDEARSVIARHLGADVASCIDRLL